MITHHNPLCYMGFGGAPVFCAKKIFMENVKDFIDHAEMVVVLSLYPLSKTGMIKPPVKNT